jgi:hypothetical protein
MKKPVVSPYPPKGGNGQDLRKEFSQLKVVMN